MKLRILLVDPFVDDTEALTSALEALDVEVLLEADGEHAFQLAVEGEADAVVFERGLSGLGGRELAQRLLAEAPGLPLLVRTRQANVDEAFELGRLGLRAYSLKQDEPVTEFARRVVEIASGEDAGSRLTLAAPEAAAPAPDVVDLAGDELPFRRFRTRNEETAEIFRTAMDRVAAAPATVLITGESGTGKELLARTIHHHSPRKDGPWMAVNCAALPENLIESELFGHEKGAFTGATSRRIGRFEQAQGGTFFLDEVGDLSPLVQTKLLRVLQERSIERVGGTTPIRVDVRIIAATHRNLKKRAKNDEFREDLYYRLSVITLELPPLRERPEDIAGLSRFFLEHFRRSSGRRPMVLTPRALDALRRYPWPGNVRELENVMERAVVLALRDRVDLEDLPVELQQGPGQRAEGPSLREARAQFERDFIREALLRQEGNVSATAELLGIARKNLQEKIKRYEIDIESIREGQPLD